jgi:hypothetical protein
MLFDTVRMDKRHCYAAKMRVLLDSAPAVPVAWIDVDARGGGAPDKPGARASRWGNVFLQSLYGSLFSVRSPPPPSLQFSSGTVDDLQLWRDVLRSDSSSWGTA